MKNKEIDEGGKVYEKEIVALNLNRLIEEKGITHNKLAEKSELSKQGLLNILHFKSCPRERTVELLAEALEVPVSDLTEGQVEYNREIMQNVLAEKYNPDDHEGLNLDQYLIVNFPELDVFKFIINRWMPNINIRKKIAKHFGINHKRIFVPVTEITHNKKNIQPKDVIKGEFDEREFQWIFKKLNAVNKKIVLNLCCDLVKAQQI